eukprot:scaffold4251_cov65-Attheya_sp.AAC.1
MRQPDKDKLAGGATTDTCQGVENVYVIHYRDDGTAIPANKCLAFACEYQEFANLPEFCYPFHIQMNYTSWVNNKERMEIRKSNLIRFEMESELVGLAGLICERALVNVRAKAPFSSEKYR